MNIYWSMLKESFNKFLEDDIFTHAAALAYYTIFSLPPMLLIIMYSTTLFYDRATIQKTIFDEIAKLVGQDGAVQLSQTIDQIGLFEGGIWATIIGIGALLFTSTTVFVTIQSALNKIFKVKAKPKRGLVKLIIDRVLSFTLLIGIGFILIVSLAVSALITAFGTYLERSLPDFTVIVTAITSFVLPLAVLSVLFAGIFKLMPDAKLDWRETWVGAVVTAILFSIGKYLIGFYIGTSNTANLYDAAGSIMVMMVWIFYASIIFLYGAVFTYVYAKNLSGGIQPSTYAVRVEQLEIEIPKETSHENENETKS